MISAIKHAMSAQTVVTAGGVACLIYGGFIGLSVFGGKAAIDRIESRMAAQNIAFERVLPKKVEDIVDGLRSADMQPPKKAEPKELTQEELYDLTEVSKDALPPAPFHGLSEESNYGGLPVIGGNRMKPFDAYKKPTTIMPGKPVIALAITGLGLSDDVYDGIFKKLSPQASLILSPYIPDIDEVKKAARSHGYEVWLSLPFENKHFPKDDPGPLGILVNAGLKFNQGNYKTVLGLTSGYAGIAAYTDSAFEDAKPMLTGILGEAFSRGLGYFELNSGRDAMSKKTAVNSRAPYIVNSLRPAEESIEKRFTAFKRLARRNDQVVGVVEISPAMIDGFLREIIKAQEEGFQIVPISAVADRF